MYFSEGILKVQIYRYSFFVSSEVAMMSDPVEIDC